MDTLSKMNKVDELIRSKEFQALAVEHAKMNFFEILNKSHDETSHSSFLAWMLSDKLGLGTFPMERLGTF